jgi:hypothetical protein
LLEEFNYTVKYKPCRMQLQADHSSRLLKEMAINLVDDRLIDDNLFVVTAQSEWYAGTIKILITQQFSGERTKEDMINVRINSRYYVVIGHRLFRRETNGLLRRCVSEVEMPSILAACHNNACRGHFYGQLTCQKIFRAFYFWSTLFKDAHDYVKRCDVCQRYAKNDLRMKMPLYVSLLLVPFEK